MFYLISYFKRVNDDLYLKYSLPFVQASLGTEINIETIKGKSCVLKIPEGTETGTLFRLRGFGMPKLNSS